jgi:hypothetical protein
MREVSHYIKLYWSKDETRQVHDPVRCSVTLCLDQFLGSPQGVPWDSTGDKFQHSRARSQSTQHAATVHA